MPRLVPVDYRKLVKLFETVGFILDRQTGDHLVYVKKGIKRPIIIPMYREIPEFIILKNLKTADITRNAYLKLLKEI